MRLCIAVHAGVEPSEKIEQLLASHGITSADLAQLQPDPSRPNKKAPTAASVARLYGLEQKDFYAAQSRADRHVDSGDQRRILTAPERRLLAQYVGTLADNNKGRRRALAVVLMYHLLETRHAARERALELKIPDARLIQPLNDRELDFLARLSTNPEQPPLREKWFQVWEAEFAPLLETARTQDPHRLAAATRSRCEEHFRSLGNALRQLNFLHDTGPHAGTIRLDRTSLALCLDASVHPNSTLPEFACVNIGLSHVWSIDKMPGLNAGLGMLQGDFRSEHSMDRGAATEQASDRTLTVVLAISLDGALAPPMVIHKQGTLPPEKIAGPANLPSSLVFDHDFGHFASCANNSGDITRPLFLGFCRRLRAFVGHREPILLISDGLKTRIPTPLMAYLKSINIFLFLAPPHTSHWLSPNDQWHQHIYRDRTTLLFETPSVAQGGSASLDEKIVALYAAIHKQHQCPERIQSAFGAAGIAKDRWGIDLMRHQPLEDAPDQRAANALSALDTMLLETKKANPGPLSAQSSPQAISRWGEDIRRYATAQARLIKCFEQRFLDVTAQQQQLLALLTPVLGERLPKRARVDVTTALEPSDAPLAVTDQQSAASSATIQSRSGGQAACQQIQEKLGLPATTKEHLKTACQRLGLAWTGNKPDLLARLQAKMGLVTEAQPSTASAHDVDSLESAEASMQNTIVPTTATAILQSVSEVQPNAVAIESPRPSSGTLASAHDPTVNGPNSEESGSFFDCVNICTNSSLDLRGPLFEWVTDLPEDLLRGNEEVDPALLEAQWFQQPSQLNMEEMDRLIQACDGPTRAYRAKVARLTSAHDTLLT
ncbi:uncharacterized protein MONBRDRAFT_11010 [Monosiga brevicollis MX1]|uniref:SAP domain-containing protein n=1 Tax=Monosiga brevicollis TaxID=81824 RepID=A9V7Y0_MONBE|nr:uncharacterized protein MONBRDRAFT_11010 [Monosiga brevicollis MX1]EDQ86382.1 predicted protein [Monosiga brevicollis MX1]|eukprot:XP_001748772.1 hypothetical protein [Monosiga brevicollis MX1]